MKRFTRLPRQATVRPVTSRLTGHEVSGSVELRTPRMANGGRTGTAFGRSDHHARPPAKGCCR
jgi:hypothetical protein